MRIAHAMFVVMALGCNAFGQERARGDVPYEYPWHEYVYLKEKFAITFPFKPLTYADSEHPGVNVWTLRFTPYTGLSLHALLAPNCEANLKASVLDGASRAGMSIPKAVRMGQGIVAFETERINDGRWRYYRFWCGDKVAFDAFANGPEGTPKPQEIWRVLDSFRIVSAAK